MRHGVVAGETDLPRLLATLDVGRRSGRFAFVTGEWPALVDGAVARIEEAEGPTLVVDAGAAREAGAPVELEFAWLTLTVHSSLAAVGLTAAVSRALAAADIACNVIAGYHHDHLLVPVDRADDAIRALRHLDSESKRAQHSDDLGLTWRFDSESKCEDVCVSWR